MSTANTAVLLRKPPALADLTSRTPHYSGRATGPGKVAMNVRGFPADISTFRVRSLGRLSIVFAGPEKSQAGEMHCEVGRARGTIRTRGAWARRSDAILFAGAHVPG
jgi:hypothetical protein